METIQRGEDHSVANNGEALVRFPAVRRMSFCWTRSTNHIQSLVKKLVSASALQVRGNRIAT